MPTRYFLVAIAAVATVLTIAEIADEIAKAKRPEVSFVAKPESMRECDPPAVATLTWNVFVPGVQYVKIFVVHKDGSERIFSQEASSGIAQAGPWVSTGAV